MNFISSVSKDKIDSLLYHRQQQLVTQHDVSVSILEAFRRATSAPSGRAELDQEAANSASGNEYFSYPISHTFTSQHISSPEPEILGSDIILNGLETVSLASASTTTAAATTTTTTRSEPATTPVSVTITPAATIAMTSQSSSSSWVDWTAVLFECFVIITLGYLSSRFKLISPQAKDIHSYLATYALPMIIFLNIAQMEFQTVDMSFLVSMIMAKAIVFMSVTLLTLLISKPTNFGYAGALSILATQSNDFALGYPLIKSLYGESEMLNYLSLQVPIQLLIFNPLGIAMLEHEKSKTLRRNVEENDANMIDPSAQKDLDPNVKTRNTAVSPLSHKGQRPNLCTECMSSSEGRAQSDHAAHSDNQSDSVIYIQEADCNSHGTQATEINLTANDSNNNSTHPMNSNESRNHETIETNEKLSEIKEVESRIEKQIRMLRANLTRSCTVESRISNQNSQCSLISGSNLRTDIFGQTSISLSSSTSQLDMMAGNKLSCPCCDRVLISSPEKKSKSMLSMLNCNFIASLAMNPLIMASLVALGSNIVFGPELPKYIARVSKTIAASFAGPALFVIGVSMVGKFTLLRRNPSQLLLSTALVFTKLVVLPNLMRFLSLKILPSYLPAEEYLYLVQFSYLYGSLPTAPTAVVIAQQYGVLTDVISLSMLLGTILSGPILFGVAVYIDPANSVKSSFESEPFLLSDGNSTGLAVSTDWTARQVVN